MRQLMFQVPIGVGILVAVTTMPGCDYGAQLGRFSGTGHHSKSLALGSNRGLLEIVSGTALATDGQVAGPDQNLIYLVVVCIDPNAEVSNTKSEDGRYLSKLHYTWRRGSAVVPFLVQWDRRSDRLLIGGQEFVRDDGNVFIVRCDGDGNQTAQQFPSLGPKAEATEVLLNVREKLPDDRLIQSLTEDRLDGP